MMKISGVTKRHGQTTILSDVSFEARPGRVTAFLGANGAGKSSTLRILLGLDRPTSGTALINGVPYAQLPHPARTIGAMLDGSGAHRSRTAKNHLAWVACAAGIPRQRIGEVLELVGLTGASGVRVGRYSLGMGQRLGIATALLGRPKALVLDEPVNGLDPEGVRWIRGLLRSHADAGGTVLLSSHLLGEVAEIADDLVVIHNGRIIADGSITEVTAGHASVEDAYFALTSGEAHR